MASFTPGYYRNKNTGEKSSWDPKAPGADQFNPNDWELIEATSTGGERGGGVAKVNPRDYTVRTGLPKGMQKKVQKLANKYLGSTWGRLDEAARGFEKEPEMIEAQRAALNRQFQRDLLLPTSDAVRSAVSRAFGRGTVRSSVWGKTMGSLSEAAMRAAAGQQTQSNVWAANALRDNLVKNFQAQQGMAGLLGEYIGLTRESIDPTAALRLGTIDDGSQLSAVQRAIQALNFGGGMASGGAGVVRPLYSSNDQGVPNRQTF